ncbi:DNA ligase 3 [Procambarus clarkii]|uniref:DNA ligase 3 n=1 Tax=Procambarus clarkii TaxID=6728 RepID=UPI00374348DC
MIKKGLTLCQFHRVWPQLITPVVLTRNTVEPVSIAILHSFIRKKLFSDCKFPNISSCSTLRSLPSPNKVSIPLDYYNSFHWNCFGIARMSSFPFYVEYDKRGAAKCKKCKEKCEKGIIRIGKIVPNPFSESGGEMKQWYHVDCLFDMFKRARATTKKIEDPVEDIEGWETLEDDDQKKIRALIDDLQNNISQKKTTPKKQAQKATPTKQTPQKATPTKQTPQKATPNKQTPQNKQVPNPAATQKNLKVNRAAGGHDISKSAPPSRTDPGMDRNHKDNSFREFRRICASVAEEPSYLSKTEIMSNFLKNGTSKTGFEGDLRLWVKLLLPGVVKRVYNLQSKQLVKLFSQLFNTNLEEMIEDLEQGDVAETIRKFFEESKALPPIKKSILTIHEVDELLEELTGKTREEEQSIILKKIAKKSTGNDLKMIVRLIKADLRINAGAKHVLDAVRPGAYEAFQTTRNIDSVMDQILAVGSSGVNLQMTAQVMTPVLPMLAEACKSVDYAFKKCPSGAMFSEIKYDGERVQVHKLGNDFAYFSRSLKPVMPHKVSHFKDYIPKAFPHGKDLILDSEVLLISTKTGNPLPFGTLGIHKKAAFEDANVCLFVFDCIHYNGEDLMNKPLTERRKVLEESMVEIKNHIMFSEMKLIRKKDDLRDMIKHVLKEGLEGLVLKDINSIYEPGKRHWLKVKKDYLNDGAMADSADLVVLGAWYGTGKKGGMMSVFLMGCYDPNIDKWCTTTKVHTGFDDAALERLQTELDMVKISQDVDRVPPWLKCNKPMIPDFVVADPKKAPVWEITGAEFTRHQIHTADGISIRFPRVTRERKDKTWKEATNLAELQILYKNSRECLDFESLASDTNDRTDDDDDSGKRSGGSGFSTPVTTVSSNSVSPNKAIGEKAKNKVQKTLGGSNKGERVQEDKIQEKARKEVKQEKRKSGETMGETPPKKMCKYGASCYNDNVAHQYLYDHPVPLLHTPPTVNPLPDIFIGVQVSMPDTIDKIDVLKRYIIAYGGEVVPEYKATKSTHFIVPAKDTSLLSSCVGPRVIVDWLWDSIKLQKLQPTKMYYS